MTGRLSAWVRTEWRAIIIIVAAAAIQIFLITRPLPFLLGNIIPDDAFYYFDIARSIVLGHGSAFNGIDPTNGYHPLWLITLLPIFKIWYAGAGDLAPIRAALVLSAALNAATAFIVLRILARFAQRPRVRAFGMIVWVLNPFVLYEGISGLETPLALFFFALLFLLALRLAEGKLERFWIVGLIGGLMVLARIDYGLYLGALLAWIFVARGARKAAEACCAAAIPILPWLGWNIAHFHMLLTDSGNAEALVNHVLIVQDHGASVVQFGKALVYNIQYALNDVMQRTGMFSIFAAFIGAGVSLAACSAFAFPKQIRDIGPAWWLCGGFAALFLADAGIRWTDRSWYFVSFSVFVAILAVVVVGRLTERLASWRVFVGLLACLTLFSFYVDWSKNLRGGMSSQIQMYQASLWMNAHLPSGSRIGVFNAGIEEYFSTQTIVNLDGLVNEHSYAALQSRSMWSYVESNRIGYIADFDEYLAYRYVSFWGTPDVFDNLALVYNVGDATTTVRSQTGVNIYKIH